MRLCIIFIICNDADLCAGSSFVAAARMLWTPLVGCVQIIRLELRRHLDAATTVACVVQQVAYSSTYVPCRQSHFIRLRLVSFITTLRRLVCTSLLGAVASGRRSV